MKENAKSKDRFTVTVQVAINAKTPEQAVERVKKAVVCLENSLRYAEPHVEEVL